MVAPVRTKIITIKTPPNAEFFLSIIMNLCHNKIHSSTVSLFADVTLALTKFVFKAGSMKSVFKTLLLGVGLLQASCSTGLNQSVNSDSERAATDNSQQSNDESVLRIKADAKVLLFTKTAGWRHDSIPEGIAFFDRLATKHRLILTATEDASVFTDAVLEKTDIVVFMNTTGDVLDKNQQIAMERFIQSGGGFVGIHAAADTESDAKDGEGWFWYRNLVGGIFNGHPNDPAGVQSARLTKTGIPGPLNLLPETFEFADEWYDYRDLYEFRRDLLTLDDSSYIGSQHEEYHPITWFQEYDGGRAFYTGLGHPKAVYSDPLFEKIVTAGLHYALGDSVVRDYSRSRPKSDTFSTKVVATKFDSPTAFDFLSEYTAIVSERPGQFVKVDLRSGVVDPLGKLADVKVSRTFNSGLLAVAVDPQYAINQRIHFLYSAFTNGQLVLRVAHAPLVEGSIDLTRQKITVDIPVSESCCHFGGSLTFEDGTQNLFISIGDDTLATAADGYESIGARRVTGFNDALRSAGNTNDLRGKILRITPKADGGYTVPNGNLFTGDSQDNTRDEIYIMGVRNPASMAFDQQSKTLFFGDTGPEYTTVEERSWIGVDEINQAKMPGNFGWPLFIGDNSPYREYDNATKKKAKLFDPRMPKNAAFGNSGIADLPAAQRATIWYENKESLKFPELGSGTRHAMVAGVYRSANYLNSSIDAVDESYDSSESYPNYYDGKLFIYDAARGWFKIVTFDEYERVRKIEPFAPNNAFKLAADAKFGPYGNLFVLERGSEQVDPQGQAKLSVVRFRSN